MVVEEVNYFSIVVASLVSFIFGWIWYGPAFGNTWMRLNGINPKTAKKPKKSEMGKNMILNFAGTLIMVYVFSLLIFFTGMESAFGVFTLAVLLWVGFLVSTTLLGNVLWEKKSWGWFLLNSSYWLLNLIIIGLVLVSF